MRFFLVDVLPVTIVDNEQMLNVCSSASIAANPMLYIRPKLKYLRKRKYLLSFRKHIACYTLTVKDEKSHSYPKQRLLEIDKCSAVPRKANKKTKSYE